jgi:hypothetical protein
MSAAFISVRQREKAWGTFFQNAEGYRIKEPTYKRSLIDYFGGSREYMRFWRCL